MVDYYPPLDLDLEAKQQPHAEAEQRRFNVQRDREFRMAALQFAFQVYPDKKDHQFLIRIARDIMEFIEQ